MNRTSLPCSSSERPGRRRVPPVSGARHRVPPCPAILPWSIREILHCPSRHARCERLPSPLLHLLNNLLKLLWHRWYWLSRELGSAIGAPSYHNVKCPEFLILRRIIIAEVSTATFF